MKHFASCDRDFVVNMARLMGENRNRKLVRVVMLDHNTRLQCGCGRIPQWFVTLATVDNARDELGIEVNG